MFPIAFGTQPEKLYVAYVYPTTRHSHGTVLNRRGIRNVNVTDRTAPAAHHVCVLAECDVKAIRAACQHQSLHLSALRSFCQDAEHGRSGNSGIKLVYCLQDVVRRRMIQRMHSLHNKLCLMRFSCSHFRR